MTKAKLKITHPILGTFESVSMDAKEEESFLEVTEEYFKKGELEYMVFNQATTEEPFAKESRVVLPENVIKDSVLVINFYEE